MKLRLLLGLIVVLSITNCGFIKTQEWREAEEFAIMIEEDMNSQNVDGLVEKFDAPLFARRLGKEFTRLSVPERSFSFGMFKNIFRSNMEQFTSDYNQLEVNIMLLGLTEKDGVYRAVYSVVDVGENVRNFLVFYLSNKEDDQFQIANYYSVYSGFSFGQSMKEFTKMINDSSNFENEIASLNRGMQQATYLYKNGQYEMAYEVLDRLTAKEKQFSHVAILKLSIADQMGGMKALKEFEHMKSIVPNEQSKLFYDCILKSLDNAPEEEQKECSLNLQILLLDS